MGLIRVGVIAQWSETNPSALSDDSSSAPIGIDTILPTVWRRRESEACLWRFVDFQAKSAIHHRIASSIEKRESRVQANLFQEERAAGCDIFRDGRLTQYGLTVERTEVGESIPSAMAIRGTAAVLRKNISLGLEPGIALKDLEETALPAEGLLHHEDRVELAEGPGRSSPLSMSRLALQKLARS